jgi:hypothetical protein
MTNRKRQPDNCKGLQKMNKLVSIAANEKAPFRGLFWLGFPWVKGLFFCGLRRFYIFKGMIFLISFVLDFKTGIQLINFFCCV